ASRGRPWKWPRWQVSRRSRNAASARGTCFKPSVRENRRLCSMQLWLGRIGGAPLLPEPIQPEGGQNAEPEVQGSEQECAKQRGRKDPNAAVEEGGGQPIRGGLAESVERQAQNCRFD